LKKSIYPDKRQEEAIVRITALYVEQVQSGQGPCLSEYLARYPEYRDAIVDFVAYYHALEEPLSQRKESSFAHETLSEISQLALERVWPRVRLSGKRWSQQMRTLLMRKDNQRLSPSYLATELDLSVDVVMQLERCKIDPLSIPLVLYRHLAYVLQQPLYSIQTYFTADRQHRALAKDTGAALKVAEAQETYPVTCGESAPCVSFRQVLMESTQMSERQKALWCAIIDLDSGVDRDDKQNSLSGLSLWDQR